MRIRIITITMPSYGTNNDNSSGITDISNIIIHLVLVVIETRAPPPLNPAAGANVRIGSPAAPIEPRVCVPICIHGIICVCVCLCVCVCVCESGSGREREDRQRCSADRALYIYVWAYVYVT
jgi:hypothetical protein